MALSRKICLLAAGAAVAVFLAALAATEWLNGDAPATGLLRPEDADLIAAGRTVYKAHCASCHGLDLSGEADWRTPAADGLMPAPPHDETGHTWHHPDRVLFLITKHGVAEAAGLQDYRSRMPAYDAILEDEEIIAALSWIKAQWPLEVRRRHDELNAQHELENESEQRSTIR